MPPLPLPLLAVTSVGTMLSLSVPSAAIAKLRLLGARCTSAGISLLKPPPMTTAACSSSRTTTPGDLRASTTTEAHCAALAHQQRGVLDSLAVTSWPCPPSWACCGTAAGTQQRWYGDDSSGKSKAASSPAAAAATSASKAAATSSSSSSSSSGEATGTSSEQRRDAKGLPDNGASSAKEGSSEAANDKHDNFDEALQPHGFFPLLGTRALSEQQELEHSEKMRAIAGLQNSDWAVLHPKLKDLPFLSGLMRRAGAAWWGRTVEDEFHTDALQTIVQKAVDASFDRDEFLSGATAACRGVYALVGAKDWSALREVASMNVVMRLQEGVERAEHLSGWTIVDVNAEVHNVELAAINLWGPKTVSVLDSRWPGEVTSSTSSSFLVVTVQLLTTLTITYTRSEARADGSNEEVSIKHVGLRMGYWIFAQGPLPRGHSATVNVPWRLLGWF